jgi:hypothetical protein
VLRVEEKDDEFLPTNPANSGASTRVTPTESDRIFSGTSLAPDSRTSSMRNVRIVITPFHGNKNPLEDFLGGLFSG